MSAGIAYRDVTLASGQSTTPIVRAFSPMLRRIFVPTGTEGETLVLLHAVSEAGPAHLMRNRGRLPIKLLFKAGDAVEIDPTLFGPLAYVAVGTRDLNGEVTVAQAADRVFQLGWAEG
jgi:hypothetical protein